jgi:hypothetical protein
LIKFVSTTRINSKTKLVKPDEFISGPFAYFTDDVLITNRAWKEQSEALVKQGRVVQPFEKALDKNCNFIGWSQAYNQTNNLNETPVCKNYIVCGKDSSINDLDTRNLTAITGCVIDRNFRKTNPSKPTIQKIIPECDVVIPYHSFGEQFTKDSLQSILNQRHVYCHIHMIMDGFRSDKFMDFRKFDNAKVYHYLSPSNCGPYRSLMKVFPFLKTDYIAIQDCDDISTPYRLHKSIDMLKSGYDIVGGNMENFVDYRYGYELEPNEVCQSFYGERINIINGTMVLKKSAFEKLNGFLDVFCGADTDFISRANLHSDIKLGVLKEGKKTIITGLRRMHGASLSSNNDTGKNTRYRKDLRTRIAQIVNLIQKYDYDPASFGELDKFKESDIVCL